MRVDRKTIVANTETPTIKHAQFTISDWKLAQSTALVNRFKFFTELTGRDFSKEMASTHTANKGFSIFVAVSRLSENSLNGVKSWLNTNPVTVTYILDTPTEEPITALEIPTFENTTIIEFNTEVQPVNMYVKYYAVYGGAE